jgi:osmotically-inducible protein OsmY
MPQPVSFGLLEPNAAARRRVVQSELLPPIPPAHDPNEETLMKLKTLAKMALIGALLVGGSAAQAAENQADWTTTLNVKLALLEKLGSDSLRIEVETTDGAVTLKGTVKKRETLELAQSVSKSVAGVKSMKSDLHLEANVENPSSTSVAAGETEAEVKDAILSTKIRMALIDKMGSDGFRIGTVAANGVVTLEFDKDFANSRRTDAVKVVKAVDGVSKVISVDKA